ncbi:oligosaccharide flippase family protein [Archaeoglobus neptunius]|uniref:oligosaccharide flippase family protein n=1 Tax=Archaeoglobus neptunius TaxID=2798580 RepID=UPI0019267723
MKLARKVARNAIYNTSALIVGSVSGLFLTIILARVMKPEQFGIYSLALSIAMVSIALANLGVDAGVVRYTAYHAGRGDLAKIRGNFRYFLKIKTVLAFSISALLAALSGQIASFFGNESLTLPIAFAGVIVLFASFTNILNAFFMGLQEFKYSFLRQVVYEISRWAFVLPLGIAYLAAGALAGFSMAYAMAFIFLLYVLSSRYREYVCGETAVRDERVNVFMGFMTLANISGMIYAYVDSIMIGYFLGTTDVGYYRAAYVPVFAVVGMISSFGGVMFPTYTQMGLEEIRASFSRILRYTSIIAFPLMVTIAYLSEQIVTVVYGVDYLPADLPMKILALALIPGAFSYLGSIFSAKERPEIPATLITVSMVLNVILNYVLITAIGIAGAAIATVVSRFFVLLATIFLLHTVFRIVPNFRATLKPLFAASVMFAVLYAFPKPETLIYGLVEIALAVCVYTAVIFLIKGVSKEDVEFLKDVFR